MKLDTDYPASPPLVSAVDRGAARSLAQSYSTLFDLVPAETSSLLEEAHRIRYEVYCRDFGWEQASRENPDIERDAFDARAKHVLLRYRPDDCFIGTVRLIEPCRDDPENSFPMQHICADKRLHDPAFLAKTVEVSRFCVVRQRRKSLGQAGDDATLAGMNRILIVGLVVAIVQTMTEHGYEHICAVMEPWLVRKFARFGVRLEYIGPPVAYHGLRQPCLMSVSNILSGMRQKSPELSALFVDRPRLWHQDCHTA